MLLLDSLYVNNGGGKVLLDYLVEKLESNMVSVHYLFDIRCFGQYQFVPSHRKSFVKASMINRHLFYKKYGNLFTKVFCFGNLPPTIQLKIPVYTYLQQRLFISTDGINNLASFIMFKIKCQIFTYLIKNTNEVFVQTNDMRKLFYEKYKNNSVNIEVIPFYRSRKTSIKYKKKYSFIYVSSGSEHKNHWRLLEAFKRFYDKHQIGELVLTIDVSFKDLNNQITIDVSKGYPITNIGFVDFSTLLAYYEKSTYCIYPSTSESFGLGIIEAIEQGCKILGADLPYMHEVCKPSAVFNPESVENMIATFERTLKEELPTTELKTSNQINFLIQKLSVSSI
jgi:glycosyltransferase involved in cell wall biosynthesis